MSEIKRVTYDPNVEMFTGVELMANCVLTGFSKDEESGQVKIAGQNQAGCKMLASYYTSTVSLHIPEVGFMVTVRIDEMMALLKEAALADIEHREESSKQ